MKTAYFDNFTITTPDDCVSECSHPGSCDEDVARWVHTLADVLDEIDPDDIREELYNCAAWSKSELRSGLQNRKRILWIAAGNIKENEYELKHSARPADNI